MNEENSRLNSKKLDRWDSIFKFFFYSTPTLAFIVFLIQYFTTSGSFSTDFHSLDNWKTFSNTFNLPIGIFTALAAITTLIGMYYRSMQLTLQLSRVETQLEIANKQFNKSEQQFELAQEQFKLAQKKENFVLYLEHQKFLREEVEGELNRTRNLFSYSTKPVGESTFRFNKFYKLMFPENTYNQMIEFGTKATAPHFEIKMIAYAIELQRLLVEVENSSIEPLELYKGIVTPVLDTGFTCASYTKLDTKGVNNLIKETVRFMQFCIVILLSYGLIKEISYQLCTKEFSDISKIYDDNE